MLQTASKPGCFPLPLKGVEGQEGNSRSETHLPLADQITALGPLCFDLLKAFSQKVRFLTPPPTFISFLNRALLITLLIFSPPSPPSLYKILFHQEVRKISQLVTAESFKQHRQLGFSKAPKRIRYPAPFQNSVGKRGF